MLRPLRKYSVATDRIFGGHAARAAPTYSYGAVEIRLTTSLSRRRTSSGRCPRIRAISAAVRPSPYTTCTSVRSISGRYSARRQSISATSRRRRRRRSAPPMLPPSAPGAQIDSESSPSGSAAPPPPSPRPGSRPARPIEAIDSIESPLALAAAAGRRSPRWSGRAARVHQSVNISHSFTTT